MLYPLSYWGGGLCKTLSKPQGDFASGQTNLQVKWHASNLLADWKRRLSRFGVADLPTCDRLADSASKGCVQAAAVALSSQRAALTWAFVASC